MTTPRVTARDPYVDLVRAIAITLVVIGHWLLSNVTYHGRTFSAEDAITGVSFGPWLTLLFQVVPLFFFVGGYANALSWSRRRAERYSWLGWVRQRLRRLLVPTGGYAAAIVAVVLLCRLLGVSAANTALAAWGVAFHLWFLSVYAVILFLTPLFFALHERFGITVVLVMAASAAVFDVGTVFGHWPLVGWANYVLVWGAFHQLGFFWRDGAHVQYRRRLPLVIGCCVAVLSLLIGFAGYPVSMVGFPGARIQNPSPPSVALLTFGLAQCGLAAWVDPWVRGWWDRVTPARLRAAVRFLAVSSMSLYLWHMVPVLIVSVIGYPLRLFPQPTVGSSSWWIQRVVWVILLAVVLAGVVALLAGFRRSVRKLRRVVSLAPVPARRKAASPPVPAGRSIALRRVHPTGHPTAQPTAALRSVGRPAAAHPAVALRSVRAGTLGCAVALVSGALARIALRGFAPHGRIDVVTLGALALGGIGAVYPEVYPERVSDEVARSPSGRSTSPISAPGTGGEK